MTKDRGGCEWKMRDVSSQKSNEWIAPIGQNGGIEKVKQQSDPAVKET